MEPEEGYERRMQRIREGGLLDVIRTRTAMYTGERTLSAVAHFLSGYLFAHTVLQVPPPSLLPPDFHDWVAYRLHFRESTMGYRNMILERFPDESLALDRFFELADAHRNRQEKVVARVQRHDSSRETSKIESGTGDGQSRASMTEEVKIVVYTDDPGFFLVQDNQAVEDTERGQFCPSLSWLGRSFRPDKGYTTVLDRGTFDRLLQEATAFTKSLSDEAELRKRRPGKDRV